MHSQPLMEIGSDGRSRCQQRVSGHAAGARIRAVGLTPTAQIIGGGSARGRRWWAGRSHGRETSSLPPAPALSLASSLLEHSECTLVVHDYFWHVDCTRCACAQAIRSRGDAVRVTRVFFAV